MFYLAYRGLKLVPSRVADEEMLRLGMWLANCKFILENGYQAPRKRAKNTEEKWMNVGKKIYNVVVVKLYSHLYEEDVYLITHVGRFTRK